MQGQALDKPQRRGLGDSARFLKSLVVDAAADRRRRALGPGARARDGGGGRSAAARPRRRARARHRAGDAGADRARLRRASGSCWSNTIRGFCRMLEARFAPARIIRGRRLRSAARRSPNSAGQPIAAVVSSLPLLNQPPQRREKLIGDAFALMGPDGRLRPVHLRPPVAHSARGLRRSLRRPSRRGRSGAICRPPASGPTGSTAPTQPAGRRGERACAARPADRRARRARRRRGARLWSSAIGDAATFYKVGMELAYGGGLALVGRLAAAGKQVFLDLKLHDIPNTVERATAQAAKLGATFLTVHAYPQTMRAAVAGAKGSGMRILAVTVLTSYDDADLFDAVRPVRRRRDGPAPRRAGARARRRRTGGERRGGGAGARRPSAVTCFSSRPASGRRARRPATRSGSRRPPRRSATAPTISSSAGRSPRRRDPRAAARRSSAEIAAAPP